MEYINLCWMESLLKFTIFLCACEVLWFDLMWRNLSFLKRMRLTRLMQFDLNQCPQIILVQMLKAEEWLCCRPISAPSIHLAEWKCQSLPSPLLIWRALVSSASIFCRGVQCCPDMGIYTWVVEPCISVEEYNLTTPAWIGCFLGNHVIFM